MSITEGYLVWKYECQICKKTFEKSHISINSTINKCPYCGDLKANNKEILDYTTKISKKI